MIELMSKKKLKRNFIIIMSAVMLLGIFVVRYISNIEEINYKESGFLFIVDDKGNVIAKNNNEIILNLEMSNILKAIEKNEYEEKSGFIGENYGYYIKKVTSHDIHSGDLYAVFTMKRNKIFRNSNRSTMTIIIGVSVILMLLGVLMYWLLDKEAYMNAEESLLREREEGKIIVILSKADISKAILKADNIRKKLNLLNSKKMK